MRCTIFDAVSHPAATATENESKRKAEKVVWGEFPFNIPPTSGPAVSTYERNGNAV